MQVDILHTRSELEAIRDAWDRLPRPSTMQSTAWLLNWWDVYHQPRHDLSVLAVRQQGELIGVVPWYAETRRNVRQLRWLGDGRVCSDHASILCHAEDQQPIVAAVADWITTATASHWRQLRLDSVDDEDQALQALISVLGKRGFSVTRRAEPGTCCVDLPTTWDGYLMSVSKNHRKKCRRMDRDFLRTGRARVDVLTSPDECLATFNRLAQLHNDRRESLGDDGAFSEPTFRQFHRMAIAELATRGAAQLRVVNIDGQSVAAEYLLMDGDRWFLYQGGLSAEGESLSAGTISMVALVKDAIAAGCRRLDLLRGDEPYKFSWGAQRRPAQTIHIRRPTAIGRVGAWRDAAWNQVRSIKRGISSSHAARR